MGEVIQLFRNDVHVPEDAFVFDEHVSEEVMDTIAAVMYDLNRIEHVTTASEFVVTMASIKKRIASLPDG